MDRPTATKTEQTWNGLHIIAAGDDIEITTLRKLLLRLKTENAFHIPYFLAYTTNTYKGTEQLRN
jgi:hypothetical protein